MSQKGRVLIVDDEPTNVDIIRHILEDSCQLESATTGEEALEKIPHFLPDLVLLDIMMPGISGYEVCKEIKSKWNKVKVVLVSAKAMVEERLQGYEMGADDYIAKPFDNEELLAKTKVFLRLKYVEEELLNLNASLEEKVRLRTAELLQATKLASIGELAAGIAHEINNPLTIVKGNLDFLQEYFTKHNEQDLIPIVSQQEKAVQRIVNIVNGLKTYARRDTEQFTDINLHLLIDESLSMVQHIYNKQNVAIVREFLCPIPFIRGNAGRFQQVVINLLANAKDALENNPNASITIRTEREGALAVVTIADNGCGISENKLQHIFDPFYTTKEAGKGTGLGLSIVSYIIQEMGGKIEVASSPNQGTKFTLRFPIVDVKDSLAEEGRARGPASASTAKKFSGRALVVEDEDSIGEILERYLIEFGFDVHRASDGVSAIEKCKANQYDLMVADLKMPKMWGDVCAEKAKREQRNLKVIGVTGTPGLGDSAEKLEKFQQFVDRCVKKPFSKGDIYQAVQEVMV